MVFVASCASGVCDTCPVVALTANGATTVTAAVGTDLIYTWTSANADTATSTVTMSPKPDTCGNMNGPWVVSTLSGTTEPATVLACQVGTSYALEVTVTQTATGDSASAAVTIDVQ